MRSSRYLDGKKKRRSASVAEKIVKYPHRCPIVVEIPPFSMDATLRE